MCIGCVAYNNSTRVRQSVSLTCANCLLPATVSAAVFELLHLGWRGSYLYGIWLVICGGATARNSPLRDQNGARRDATTRYQVGVKYNSV